MQNEGLHREGIGISHNLLHKAVHIIESMGLELWHTLTDHRTTLIEHSIKQKVVVMLSNVFAAHYQMHGPYTISKTLYSTFMIVIAIYSAGIHTHVLMNVHRINLISIILLDMPRPPNIGIIYKL